VLLWRQQTTGRRLVVVVVVVVVVVALATEKVYRCFEIAVDQLA
jgi:hypothetical protein